MEENGLNAVTEVTGSPNRLVPYCRVCHGVCVTHRWAVQNRWTDQNDLRRQTHVGPRNLV